MATALGVRMRRISRYVSDQELQEELDLADVVLCLRQPVLIGASASALHAMSSGKPTIVLEAGVFAEFPPDVVRKIPADAVISGLREALLELFDRPDEGEALGRRARDYVARVHSPERYAERLAAFLETVANARPVLDMLDELAAAAVSTGLYSERLRDASSPR